MIAIPKQSRQAASSQHDERFLELVPAIERYARWAFRNLQPQSREEAVCSVLADAFCAYRRLVELGKQDVAYAIPLARFAVARYRAGRCIANRLNSRDVSAFVAQRRRGFSLRSLDPAGTSSSWADMLADNTLTPSPRPGGLPAGLPGLAARPEPARPETGQVPGAGQHDHRGGTAVRSDPRAYQPAAQRAAGQLAGVPAGRVTGGRRRGLESCRDARSKSKGPMKSGPRFLSKGIADRFVSSLKHSGATLCP